MNTEKLLLAIIAGTGSLFAYVGTWSNQVAALGILMGIDFLVGLAMALFVGKSKKTSSGKVESYACRRGVIKKCVMFLMVYASYTLGKVANVTFLADAVCIAFITSEAISIVEHAAILGLPIPKVLIRVLEVMKEKSGEGVDALAGGGVTGKKDDGQGADTKDDNDKKSQ